MTLTLELLPRISVSPTGLKRLLEPGQTTSGIISILNPGYAELTYNLEIEYVVGSGWLSLVTTSGNVPSLTEDSFEVMFDANILGDGVYTAKINIASNAPETPLVVIPITLIVGEDLGQLVQLRAGWSGISSYQILDVPALEDLFAEQIANGAIEIMLDPEGIFWPGQNVNQIGDWNTHKGYKVKMNLDDAALFVGQFADDKSVMLPIGLSYLPVLSKEAVSASEIFDQIDGKLLYAFDIYNGLVYWPEGGIYTLETLEPGVGYLVYMVTPGEVTYEGTDGVYNYVKPVPQIVNNAPWLVENTGNAHFVSIYSSAFESLKIGDIVAVLNSDGQCMGMVQYDGGSSNLSLVVYGNDFTTESLDGMSDNETMNIVIYSPSTKEFSEVQVSWDESQPNTGAYVKHGLSAITSFKLGYVGVEQLVESGINIYPNPATDNVTISVNGIISGDAQIMVYDTRGSELINLPLADKSTALAISHLHEGMYIVRVINNGFTFTEKLIIQK
jgi:hypothetical protein